MLTDAQLLDKIHSTLIAVWETKIKEDYENGWLFREDTLKNAIYFHLRKELETLFDENDIRIYTEFTGGEFAHSRYRPDMVIARVDMEYDGYWCDAIKDCLAVIEIKFKYGFAPNKDIYADYKKLEDYIRNVNTHGHLYMATIWEYWDDATSWIEDDDTWAKGKVTELNASYIPDSDREMRFYHVAH